MSGELFIFKKEMKENKAIIGQLSRETKNLREDNINSK